MQNQINTSPLTQFAQLLRATELSQQKELKLPIQQARLLNATLVELLDKVNQDYEELFKSLHSNERPEKEESDDVITIQLDGGFFGD
jgi:hypothetical protein